MRFKGPAGQFEVAGILGKNSCVDCGQTWRANQVFVAIIDDTVLFSASIWGAAELHRNFIWYLFGR